jgi:hypothetical protein
VDRGPPVTDLSSLFDAHAELRPMSGIDELMIHNHPHPMRVMWTGDPGAYERLWFSSMDQTGDLFVSVGIGMYPNLNTMDAFVIVNCRGQHTTVRGARKLGTNRTDMAIGPIRLEVVKPFEEWHLQLDENDHGITVDLRWFDTKRSVYNQIGAGIMGYTAFEGVCGYETFGQQEGVVTVRGERFQLTRSTYCGSRDHHWGVRDGVGGPGRWNGYQHHHSGEYVEFPEVGLFGSTLVYPLGDERKGLGHLKGREHRLRFEPETELLLGGEVDLFFPDGDIKTLTFERLGNQIGFMRCAMYGGPNGGTPDRDLWHGMSHGKGTVITGETYDVNDPEVRQRIRGLDEHHARFELDGQVAHGISETYDPLCYEWAKAGRLGFSILGA